MSLLMLFVLRRRVLLLVMLPLIVMLIFWPPYRSCTCILYSHKIKEMDMREGTTWKKERHSLSVIFVQARASSLIRYLSSATKRRGSRGLPMERDWEAWDGPPPACRSNELPSSQLLSALRASVDQTQGPAPRILSVGGDDPVVPPTMPRSSVIVVIRVRKGRHHRYDRGGPVFFTTASEDRSVVLNAAGHVARRGEAATL